MNISSQIFQAGRLAVDDYINVSGILREDAIPERSLSVHMAIHLHRLLGLRAPNEEPYTRIAKHFGISDGDPRLLQVEQWKADIALYDQNKPVAVIENKILSDGKRSLSAFAWDLCKGDPVNLSERVPIYAVALICETETTNGDLKWVERGLHRPLIYSEEICTRAPNETWKWCIGCIRIWRGAASI
jgi:hypothetical protein